MTRYAQCEENRDRICILCGKAHKAFHSKAASPFCPSCRTPQLCKEELRLRKQLKRAQIAGMPATLTFLEWLTILNHFEWKCAYCRTAKHQIMEHILSVSKGGGTTADNCIPCCTHCNRLKDVSSSIGVFDIMPKELKEQVKAELAKALSA